MIGPRSAAGVGASNAPGWAPSPEGAPSPPPVGGARDPGRPLDWLVADFARRTPGVLDAVVVSADGLLVAMSAGLDRATADQLAAVTAGLSSLTEGAARVFDGGAVRRVLVEMARGLLFVTTLADRAALAVCATASCDVGLVGAEIDRLVDRAGRVLTPETVTQMRARLQR